MRRSRSNWWSWSSTPRRGRRSTEENRTDTSQQRISSLATKVVEIVKIQRGDGNSGKPVLKNVLRLPPYRIHVIIPNPLLALRLVSIGSQTCIRHPAVLQFLTDLMVTHHPGLLGPFSRSSWSRGRRTNARSSSSHEGLSVERDTDDNLRFVGSKGHILVHNIVHTESINI